MRTAFQVLQRRRRGGGGGLAKKGCNRPAVERKGIWAKCNLNRQSNTIVTLICPPCLGYEGQNNAKLASRSGLHSTNRLARQFADLDRLNLRSSSYRFLASTWTYGRFALLFARMSASISEMKAVTNERTNECQQRASE